MYPLTRSRPLTSVRTLVKSLPTAGRRRLKHRFEPDSEADRKSRSGKSKSEVDGAVLSNLSSGAARSNTVLGAEGDDTESRQALYYFYLRKEVRCRTPNEATAAQIPSAKASERPPALHAHALSAWTDHTRMDMDLATQRMETYVASTHAAAPQRSDARKRYSLHSPGMKILNWYLQTRAYDRYNILLHQKFFGLLAHCLVAERAEHWLLRLLRSKHVPAVMRTLQQPFFYWKGPVLRSFVAATLFWSDDATAFANGCAVFHKFCPRRVDFDRPELFVNKSQAGQVLNRMITVLEPKYLDPTSLDDYVSTLHTWSTFDELLDKQWTVSWIQLINPSKSDPWPAMRWLESFDQNPDHPLRKHGQIASESPTAYRLYLFILRLAQTLDRQGDRRDACHAIDIGAKNLPRFFASTFDHAREPPDHNTMRVARRRPTSREIRQGVQIDSDGYVVQSKLGAQVLNAGRRK